MLRRHGLTIALWATIVGGACSADPPDPVPLTARPGNGVFTTVEGARAEPQANTSAAHATWEGRVDIQRTGNRVSNGKGGLAGAPQEIVLASPAIWLVPTSPERGARWVAVLDDGSLVVLDLDQATAEVVDPNWGDAEPFVTEEGEILATLERPHLFEDQLSDSRWVTDGELSVVLTEPTERYGHGVLGDRVEAAAISILHEPAGERHEVQLAQDVVEGTSAILADVTGDGGSEILVTQSNAQVGARLVVYDRLGQQLAESPPIGLGNRWRNQLAVGPLGPEGEIEIVDIRTPHIGGVIEWFRVEDGRLVQVANLSGFTSHVIGSRNLDLAIVADADGDGDLEVVAPSADRRRLGVIARTHDGAERTITVELSDRLASNFGAVDHPDGTATYAAGTADGVIRFWLPE